MNYISLLFFPRINLWVAMQHFKNNFILDSCSTNNVHELFINVGIIYGKLLTNSIKKLISNKQLKPKGNKYYCYLILDANLLYKLLDSFDTNSICIRDISLEDLYLFKQAIIYIGKGCNNRKTLHMLNAKTLFEKNTSWNIMQGKFRRIVNIWKGGDGVIAFQIFSDSDHYVALSRENAMINAAGCVTSNINKGSVYGLMKEKWTKHEIKNFGELQLYFALKQCIVERPAPIFPENIKKKKNVHELKKYHIKTNYEFNGIMDCFLNL